MSATLAVLLLLAACSVPQKPEPPLGLSRGGGALEAEVILSEDGPLDTAGDFILPSTPWRVARITLRSIAPRAMPSRISCDGEAWVRAKTGTRPAGPGSSQRVVLESRFGAPLRVDLSPAVTRCDLEWGEGARLQIRRADVEKDPGAAAIARIDTEQRACVVPPEGQGDALFQAFYANTALSMGCATPPGPVQVAHAPMDALAVRMEALTGSEQDRAALARGDPDMPLDFSRAPKLELIYLTSLYLRADFSGTLVRRALEYHAERGTRVRVLVTDALQSGKDRSFWDEAASRYPNIEVQYFTWSPRGLVPPGAALDSLQRANHVKILATVSSEPGRSRVVTGGRNLHDGYFFATSLDLSAHPDLRNFGASGFDGLAWWAAFRDTDLVFSDDAMVREVTRHLAKLWTRDADGAVARPYARAGRVGAVPTRGVARHFISVPWADGRALEASFVSLIDAARREIVIVTPFLYPPKSIDEALLRAVARGVKVKLVTRRYSTEPARVFTASMSKRYVNRRFDDFEIWDYDGGEQMIHTKIMLIDGRLGMSSSINLNARSFLQDTENGVMILDADAAAQLMEVVETYRKDAVLVKEAIEFGGLPAIIARDPFLWQYF